MLLYVVLCLAAALASGLEEPIPVWSPTFSVRMSSADSIKQLWVDNVNNRTRTDTFGMNSLFYEHYNKEYKTALARRVFPVTTEEHLNVRRCFTIMGWELIFYMSENRLPELSQYHFIGKERRNGEDAAMWRKTYPWPGSREYTLATVWVTYKQGVFIPIRLEYEYHCPATGYMGKFYIDYFDYDTSDIDPEIWNIEKGLTCEFAATSGLDEISGLIEDVTKSEPIENTADINNMVNDFADFRKMHSKMYDTEDEHERRLKIFAENVRYINEHNAAGHSYKFAVNYLADRSKEELMLLHNGRYSSGPSEALPFPYTAGEVERLSQDLPEQFDWRLYGAVTPVRRYPNYCYPPYAIIAVGAVEGALFLHNGSKQLKRLSKQAIIDCSWGFGNRGCMGGSIESSYVWMMKHGLPTEEAYPSSGVNGYCTIDNVKREAYVKAYYKITPNDEKALQLAIVKHGPVAAIITIPIDFNYYSHGIFYDKTCQTSSWTFDFPVLVIGYGVLDGEKYWILRGSDPGMGMDGFMFLSTKDNSCGIMKSATYVTVE